MTNKNPHRKPERCGAVVVLVALLMVPFLAMVAFAVDYGFILKVRTDLQRAADAAVLAAVQDLVPAADGTQDLAAVRDTVRSYAASNSNISFQVLDSDIEIGRYDPDTFYTNFTILDSGTFDTVRATLRYDDTANAQVSLFFARALGVNQAPVVATAAAVIQKAKNIEPGSKVLPFALPIDVWEAHESGDEWSIYGDGKLKDGDGNDVPGNWGTLDIGPENNSTADLNDQILNGLKQSDLDALYDDGRIPESTHIDGNSATWMSADTGLSSGIKNSVQQIHGETRLVPIYDTLRGSPLAGENLEYQVVAWGVVEVVTSYWQGTKNTSITISKSYLYDGDLRPGGNAGETEDIIPGAFTSPVLVE